MSIIIIIIFRGSLPHMVPMQTVSVSFANIVLMGVIWSFLVLLLVDINIIPLLHVSKVMFRKSEWFVYAHTTEKELSQKLILYNFDPWAFVPSIHLTP